MPIHTDKKPRARHIRGEADPSGFSPNVTGYANVPPATSGRAMVGEDPLMPEGAPRPIGVDPAATGSFEKLSGGEGAVVTNRNNAEQAAEAARTQLRDADATGSLRLVGENRPKVHHAARRFQINPKLFAGIAAAALIIVILIVVAANSVFDAAQRAHDAENSDAAQEQQQVQTSDVIAYHDQNFGLEQHDDGSWSLVKLDVNGNVQSTLVNLSGTPVSFIHYNGAFLIPENLLDGTWDVLSYMPGDGSVPSPVADSDGNSVSGDGSITSAQLTGSQLTLQTDSGDVSVALE